MGFSSYMGWEEYLEGEKDSLGDGNILQIKRQKGGCLPLSGRGMRK